MGTWQILLFALIAIKIKANAPAAHNFPEIVPAPQHDRAAYATYLFYGWATNMLVGACLVLGGSQFVAALSGVNVYAACFLISFMVAAYAIADGLRSTFIADYTHTTILFIAISGFSIYSTNPAVGLPGKFYDLPMSA
jgi:Na+/proline symporter